MKTTFAIIISILAFTSVLKADNIINQINGNEVTATFNGITDDYLFKFTDTKGQVIFFYEIDEEVEINIYEDEYIGKKFVITWENEKIEILDDEGEPTGEFENIKKITELVEVN